VLEQSFCENARTFFGPQHPLAFFASGTATETRSIKAIQLSLLVFAVLTLTATVGIYWLARARAGRRLRAVLDTYVEREQAKRTYSGKNVPAGT